jgi:hypothetical protein
MKLLLPEKAMLAAPYIKRRLVAEKFRTVDTAFQFRMNAGFPGDVNRGHPASIQPALIDSNAPPTAYGQAVVIDATTQGVRPIVAGDSALTDIWGVTVRPYPIQQATTNQSYGEVAYGSVAPPTLQPIDILRGGYIMVNVGTLYGSPVKGGPVFIFYAATGGGHIQGGFEGATGATTIALNPLLYQWNSPPDASGVAELILNKF